MILSIIIPAYKVECYIDKCLLSVINQSETKTDLYEIIVVDDGSPDRSGEIAESLLLNKPNTKIIHQKNKGLSEARNEGLKIAKGDYIWFIDSDDWIYENSLRLIFDVISEKKPDVIKIRAIDYYSDLCQNSRHKSFDENINTSGPAFGKDNLVDTPVQFSICRRNLLLSNNLHFYPSIYHEDNEFSPKLFWYAKTIAFINTPLYFYRQNPSSITKTSNPKRSFDLIKVCNSLSLFLETEEIKNRDIEYYYALNDFICLSLNNALNNILHSSEETKKDFERELSVNNHLLKHLKASRSVKYKIEYYFWLITKKYILSYSFLLKFKRNA